jgi:hypothetical protein
MIINLLFCISVNIKKNFNFIMIVRMNLQNIIKIR